MDIRETLAANMRHYRKTAHLTQEGLAERCGLHRTYIGGIEQTRVNVSLKNIGKIADALDVDPALLLIDQADDENVFPRSAVNSPRKAGDASINLAADDIRLEVDGRRYALVQWSEDGVEIRSLDVRYRDLTIQVLLYLVEQGYTGDELLEAYKRSANELYLFLQGEE